MSIHDGHRDRMRRQLKTSGMDSLSDVQVLEVLLYYAAPRGDTNPTAHALLSRFGTLDSVFSAPESELKKVNGVGDAAAQLIRLVPQVARRCLMSRSAQIEILDTTSKCGQYLLPYFHGESEEVVYLLCLDAKCKALDCVLIHRGGVNVASIAARKVVKAALDANATSVVLSHNHPSGLARRNGKYHCQCQPAHAGSRAQQDAGRAAVLGIPRVFSGKRRGILHFLLRLLPA